MIFFKNLKKQKNIVHGILERKEGSVNPFSNPKSGENILNALRKLGFKDYQVDNLIFADQVHGINVYFCPPDRGGYIKLQTDGLISQTPGQILVIKTADCIPLLIYGSKKGRVGAIHAGRESLMKGIIEEAIKIFSSPSSLIIGIGPHIRKCCYSLNEKKEASLNSVFQEPWGKYLQKRNDKFYFDLTQIAKDKLLKLGVKKENIEDSGICTFCQGEKFYSARKLAEKKAKKQNLSAQEKFPCFGSFIGLLPKR